MFAYLIPLAVIVLGFAGIAYIIIRKAGTLNNEARDNLLYPEIKKDPKEVLSTASSNTNSEGGASGIKRILIVNGEKFFRKARIRLMRLENWLTKITNKLHEHSSRKKGFLEEKEGIESAKLAEEKNDRDSLVALNKQDEKFDEEYWINILKHDPTSVYPYKKLGEIYVAREDFNEARSVLKYALKLDSSDEEARAKLEALRGKRTRRKIQSA